MPHELIKHVRFAAEQRIICISDIHGHLDYFDRLIEKISFSSDDRLIIIGDIIENGADCLGALRRAMELKSLGNCEVLAGNWDYFMHIWLTSEDPIDNAGFLSRTLELKDYYGSSLLWDMCREIGITLTHDSDMSAIMPKIRAHFSKEIEFLGDLPIMLDCGDFICVHGGSDTLDEAEIRTKDPYSLLKNDSFAAQGHIFDRWVITGHWPVSNYDLDIARFSPHIFPESRIAAIDGGCGKKDAAQLNALIFNSGSVGDFEWEYVDDLPRVVALDPQEPSENPLHTVWNTRFIDVIEKNNGWAKVFHHATGRTLDVPEQRLWVQNGKEVLGDCTDYALPVTAGETLSVIFETDRGLCCKKGDISGWYYGRYETKQ